MNTAAITRTHLPIGFPLPLLMAYLIFTGMVWAGTLLAAFVLTLGVSVWNEITLSAWHVVGQAARWFVVGSMWHLGWKMFELYITHGRTRRAFYAEGVLLIVAFALSAMLLYTVTFPIEAIWYGFFGWQQGMGSAVLYDSAFDFPMIALESGATFMLWAAGGFFVGSAWYRSGLLGAAAIAVGFVCIAVSTIAFGEREGPALIILDWLPMLAEPGGRPDIVVVVVLHMAMSAVLLAISWLWVRDMPVRGKSQ